jgi:diguanylate cyclase (GGDEF)-like protein/PAS domain S-box-containing protein
MAWFLRTKKVTWALALLVGTLALTFSYVSGKRYVAAVDSVEHTLTVEQAVESVLSSLRDEESSNRGFVITGDTTFLERVAVDRAEYEKNLALARSLTRDNPEQQERLSRLDGVAREKFAFMSATRSLREKGAVDEATANVTSRRGKRMMDDLNAIVGDIKRDERRLLDSRSAAARRTQEETIVAILGGVLLLAFLLAQSFVTVRRDARTLEEAALELAESEERYRVLVENVTDLIRLHGPDGQTFFVSPSIEALLGYSPEEYTRTPVLELVHPDDRRVSIDALKKFQSAELDSVVMSYRLLHKKGAYRWFEFNVSRVLGPGGVLRHYQSTGRDITERRELEDLLAKQTEELRSLSLRDGLTGLYNRRGFLELSSQSLKVARRERQELILLFVDLDGLKGINDRLGHGHGDIAIAEAAELLRATCRETDVVARLGGDEFVVLAAGADSSAIESLKWRLERAVRDLNGNPGRDYDLAFSMGVASFDHDKPVSIGTLLAEADARMYEAKAARKRAANDGPSRVPDGSAPSLGHSARARA